MGTTSWDREVTIYAVQAKKGWLVISNGNLEQTHAGPFEILGGEERIRIVYCLGQVGQVHERDYVRFVRFRP